MRFWGEPRLKLDNVPIGVGHVGVTNPRRMLASGDQPAASLLNLRNRSVQIGLVRQAKSDVSDAATLTSDLCH